MCTTEYGNPVYVWAYTVWLLYMVDFTVCVDRKKLTTWSAPQTYTMVKLILLNEPTFFHSPCVLPYFRTQDDRNVPHQPPFWMCNWGAKENARGCMYVKSFYFMGCWHSHRENHSLFHALFILFSLVRWANNQYSMYSICVIIMTLCFSECRIIT